MKKIICMALVLAMVFSLSACSLVDMLAGVPEEIVQDKKLKISNFDTYLDVSITYDGGVATNYSPYDGENPDYAGGRWKWGTANAVINITSKSSNKTEFAGCKAVLKVSFGSPFGEKDISIQLDENGNYTETVKLESNKNGIPKDGFTSTDFAVPVASYKVLTAEGDMKIHKKLDENGSVVAADAE